MMMTLELSITILTNDSFLLEDSLFVEVVISHHHGSTTWVAPC